MQLLNQLTVEKLSHGERLRLRCLLARELEESGDYEGARDAIGDLWQNVGERPATDGLDQEMAAEVLLLSGRLTGHLGSAKQVKGAQEAAKDLISESLAIFEARGDRRKVAEASADLAVCYWRQGAFDEARVLLEEAQLRLDNDDDELKALIVLRRVIVEKEAGHFNEALRIHSEAAALFKSLDNHALQGKVHNGIASVFRNLAVTERREDYVDRALIEYTAASYHFEEAGHERYHARVENNLGFLFSVIGKFDQSHAHLDRARSLFVRLKDKGSVAQVDDTRARALIAEGRYAEAERLARSAVRALEKGGEESILAGALSTHAIALARVGRYAPARAALRRATDVAERAGDLEGAGRAILTYAEELGGRIGAVELVELYERADSLFGEARSGHDLTRLNAFARRVINALAEQTESSELPAAVAESFMESLPAGESFSLKREVRRYEAALIERALRESDGIVSRAAQMLGFQHYQTLIALLNNRHKGLLHARTPVVPRRRSIIRLRAPRTMPHQRVEKKARPVTILHVEDNGLVADAVKETLELEGWRVLACADGERALAEVAGDAPLDLLLLDNNLPGLSGVELLRRARSLAHRQQTPIIMLSANECEDEALGAGANAFLRKPQDISVLVETITRLLETETVRQ